MPCAPAPLTVIVPVFRASTARASVIGVEPLVKKLADKPQAPSPPSVVMVPSFWANALPNDAPPSATRIAAPRPADPFAFVAMEAPSWL